MLEEDKKIEDIVDDKSKDDDDDKAFIDSLLNPKDEDKVQKNLGEEMTDEQKAEEALKKKNAEEAQKRRDREAKEKAEKEAKAKQEQDALAKAEAEAKAKAEEEAKKKLEEEARAKSESDKQKENQVLELAKQISDFKIKHPEIDIQKLQKDANFNEYLSGKLLGKKSFTDLFESYSEFVKRVGGQNTSELYNKNAEKPSSGSAKKGTQVPDDIYSEEDMNRLAKKIPFMSRQELAKINDKLNRSVAYYNKN